jgi:hypothetical protein
MTMTVDPISIGPDRTTDRGLLAGLTGRWQGGGFSLVASPAPDDRTPVVLRLDRTHETLEIDPIAGGVDDGGREDGGLLGFSYRQAVMDASTGALLHDEPGLWITRPPTPIEELEGRQAVARLASVPRGEPLLATGAAQRFTGVPVLKNPGHRTGEYAYSRFPSFNTTPFALPPTVPSAVVNAAGSSESRTAPGGGFRTYDVRRRRADRPVLPEEVDGVPRQDLVNDPIEILRAVVRRQLAEGHTFEGIALNVATRTGVDFYLRSDSAVGDPSITVSPTDGVTPIDLGEHPASGPRHDEPSLVYSTLWIERVSHPERPTFLQLQYAQTVVLDFHIRSAPSVNLGWPHVTVGTLRRAD